MSPAQIRTAVRFAGLACNNAAIGTENALEALIERKFKNADQALGNRSADGARLPTTGHHDSTSLNVESRFEIPRMCTKPVT